MQPVSLLRGTAFVTARSRLHAFQTQSRKRGKGRHVAAHPGMDDFPAPGARRRGTCIGPRALQSPVTAPFCPSRAEACNPVSVPPVRISQKCCTAERAGLPEAPPGVIVDTAHNLEKTNEIRWPTSRAPSQTLSADAARRRLQAAAPGRARAGACGAGCRRRAQALRQRSNVARQRSRGTDCRCDLPRRAPGSHPPATLHRSGAQPRRAVRRLRLHRTEVPGSAGQAEEVLRLPRRPRRRRRHPVRSGARHRVFRRDRPQGLSGDIALGHLSRGVQAGLPGCFAGLPAGGGTRQPVVAARLVERRSRRMGRH
jgi:hypothetical protein